MQIRQAIPDDLGFIYETFLRSFRAASTHAEGLENKTVIQLLSNVLASGYRADVAEAEGYLAGWIVCKPDSNNCMAWIYVRDMFRSENYKDYRVCRMLLNANGIDTTKRIVTPFLPNRQVRRWRFTHRPFEVML